MVSFLKDRTEIENFEIDPALGYFYSLIELENNVRFIWFLSFFREFLDWYDVDVILGAHNVGYEEPSQQTFKIINLKVHGLYHGLRKPKHLHDIAIITLDREAELNDKVQIAKISNSTKWNSKDVSMTVIGWGLTRDDGFKSYVLREVGVPIKKIDECEPIYKLRFPSESYICAKPENGKDSCQVSGKHQQLAKSSGLINQFTYIICAGRFWWATSLP